MSMDSQRPEADHIFRGQKAVIQQAVCHLRPLLAKVWRWGVRVCTKRRINCAGHGGEGRVQ